MFPLRSKGRLLIRGESGFIHENGGATGLAYDRSRSRGRTRPRSAS